MSAPDDIPPFHQALVDRVYAFCNDMGRERPSVDELRAHYESITCTCQNCGVMQPCGEPLHWDTEGCAICDVPSLTSGPRAA